MSRRTVAWKKKALEVGEDRLHLLLPHRAKGKKSNKICCRPMRNEKQERFLRVLQSAFSRKKRRQ